MRLSLHRITYHDCPIEARERITLSPEQRHALLKGLHAQGQTSEAAILQTCNRLEVYLYASKAFDEAAFLAAYMGQLCQESGRVWRQYARPLEGTEVVRRLFEVAAGLDSQMIGENQILSQVKAAYSESLNARMSKVIFNRLFHMTFRAGKTVRTMTGITCGAVSIGLAAVELAKAHLNLAQAKAMVIGAGENAQLVAACLAKAGIASLTIANRDVCRAQDLASEFAHAHAIGLTDLAAGLDEVDVVISSTAAEEPILTYQMAEPVLAKRGRPLLVIDIAVPRDIDPKVGDLDCVTLRNIDDLDRQIDNNKARRDLEIPKAAEIVERFVDQFCQWYQSLSVVPVITTLIDNSRSLARREAGRYARDAAEQERFAVFGESLVKKLLHGPISFIKDAGSIEPSAEQLEAMDLINRMFRLRGKAEDE